MNTSVSASAKAAGLSCWRGPVEPVPLAGGITNTNFVVTDGGEKFVVRVGGDIPEHAIVRADELAASRAAFAAGVSPEVVHAEPGAMVLRFVAGRTLTAGDLRDPAMLARIVPLITRVHHAMPGHLTGVAPGPASAFWVFQVLADYRRVLRAGASPDPGASPRTATLPRLAAIADRLQRAVGPATVVFGHNDLLAANLIDAGDRLWLLDWDYAGFNNPLFDLANLASNSEQPEDSERWLLQTYFAAPVTAQVWRSYGAMKCASLLREAMWSMVSEVHSPLDFDFAAYTAENLARFEHAYADFQAL